MSSEVKVSGTAGIRHFGTLPGRKFRLKQMTDLNVPTETPFDAGSIIAGVL